MWANWHGQRNAAVKGRHAAVMRILSCGHWRGPHFKLLRGEHLRGLGEIRITGEVQWRLIGHRDMNRDSFTLVMICQHKDSVYQPRDAFDVAAKRWRQLQSGLVGVKLHAYPC